MLVLVLQGVAGAGKSTYAAQRCAEFRAQGDTVAIVSADDFFTNNEQGEYRFDANDLGRAHGGCFRAFLNALARGVDVVIVDNTNTTAVEIAPYMLGAQAFGYRAEIRRIHTNHVQAHARNVHGVALATVEKQVINMAETLPPWWSFEVVPGDGPPPVVPDAQQVLPQPQQVTMFCAQQLQNALRTVASYGVHGLMLVARDYRLPASAFFYDTLVSLGMATVHRASIGEIDEHATYRITSIGSNILASFVTPNAPTAAKTAKIEGGS